MRLLLVFLALFLSLKSHAETGCAEQLAGIELAPGVTLRGQQLTIPSDKFDSQVYNNIAYSKKLPDGTFITAHYFTGSTPGMQFTIWGKMKGYPWAVGVMGHANFTNYLPTKFEISDNGKFIAAMVTEPITSMNKEGKILGRSMRQNFSVQPITMRQSGRPADYILPKSVNAEDIRSITISNEGLATVEYLKAGETQTITIQAKPDEF